MRKMIISKYGIVVAFAFACAAPAKKMEKKS
jgi:hypothetical protein